ncbi:unnamed protein product [Citrullus colocynthis]|uniref:Uncharacterized protein n=1 Tax=Citrullus colocynthis TaxID=252529 RepID=A0ABP0Y0P7_9ROSI
MAVLKYWFSDLQPNVPLSSSRPSLSFSASLSLSLSVRPLYRPSAARRLQSSLPRCSDPPAVHFFSLTPRWFDTAVFSRFERSFTLPTACWTLNRFIHFILAFDPALEQFGTLYSKELSPFVFSGPSYFCGYWALHREACKLVTESKFPSCKLQLRDKPCY